MAGIATIRYNNLNDGSDFVLGDGRKVKVDRRKNAVGLSILAQLSHQNLLELYFVNGEDLIHQHFDQTLSSFLTILGSPILRSSLPGHSTFYIALKDSYKKIIASMIKFLRYLHSKNVAFASTQADLTLDNFGVLDDNVKFWKISVESPSSLESRKRDFLVIGKFIEEHLLSALNGKFPDCMTDYLDKLKKYTEHARTESPHTITEPLVFNSSLLFTYHLAILGHSQRLIFMQNVRNAFFFLPAKYHDSYDNAVRKMRLGTESWLKRFALTAQPHPRFIPVLKFLRSKDSNVSVGSIDYLRQLAQNYVDQGDNYEINRSILRMIRNLSTHLAESCRMISDLKDAHISTMIMEALGYELLCFQACLFNEGILEHFVSNLDAHNR